jgi:type IV pilus assembly protein PilN
MIRINLLPASATGEAVSHRKELIAAGGLIGLTLAAVLVLYMFQAARLNAINTRLTGLEQQISTIRKQNQDLEKLNQQTKDLQSKLSIVNLLTSPVRRSASVRILDDLSKSTPQLLWLTEFTESEGMAKISGKAVDNQTIAAFARNLSNSLYFKEIEIRETVQEKPGQDSRRQAMGDKALPPGTPPIPVTRFLVEAAIDYLPGIEQPPAQKSKPEEKTGTKGKEPKAPAKGK